MFSRSIQESSALGFGCSCLTGAAKLSKAVPQREVSGVVNPGYRIRPLAFVLLLLLSSPHVSIAGTITFGGDLAGLLGPVLTDAVLDAGVVRDVPFAASLPGTGSVEGTVRLSNDITATSGSIEVLGFAFQSFRDAGAGSISFTLSVDQDLTYTGPALVNVSGWDFPSATFTDFPQSASMNGFPFTATPGPFPQIQDFILVLDGFGIPATSPMHLRLDLSLSLSDNALADGPRITESGFGPIEFRAYAAEFVPEPVPEPASLLLMMTAGLAGVAWRARSRK